VFWINAPCNTAIIAINTRLFRKLDFCNEVQYRYGSQNLCGL
jgi:hypothetical protein